MSWWNDRRDRRRAKRAAETIPEKLDKNRYAINRMTGGFALLVIAVTLFSKYSTDAQLEQKDNERVDRSVEACHTFNGQQTGGRAFAITLIPEMGKDFFNLTAEQALKVADAVQTGSPYAMFVEKSYPYRQCSRNCVIAQYDASIPDCIPASDEGGTTPIH